MGIQINGNTDNITATDGGLSITSLEINQTGISTFQAGVNVSGGQLDVGSNIKLGNAGVITATSFVGSGANLTGLNSDLVNDSSPQLGGDLASNSNDILMAANDRIVFGSDALRVKHTGSHADIENTTGNITIKNDSSSSTEQILIQAKGGEDSIKAIANGAVELYYDNEKIFQTNQDGATFFDSDNNFNLYFDCNGTTRGYLFVDATNGGKMAFMDSQNHPMVEATKNGAVDLYYDNSKKFSTINAGAYVTGSFGVGAATNPSHHYNQGIHVHAAGTGAVLHLTDNTSGSGAGDGFDILSNAGAAYLWQRENANMIFGTNATSRWNIYGSNGHFAPSANNTYDIGTSSTRVRNIYTNDLHLSNEGSANSVDNTWGNYTIQEGESDLYLINNRNGKKYKFNLTEVN